MRISPKYYHLLAGISAGAINGLFGTGGGMLLVPMLTRSPTLREDEVFPASVAIILPICAVSLLLCRWTEFPAFSDLLPYLLGSALGGVLCGLWGKKIPVLWLHRVLGILILWGGVRCLF